MRRKTEKLKSQIIEKEGIYCVKLVGSPYDIGFQHGNLLKKESNNGIQSFLSGYIDRILNSHTQSEALTFVYKKILSSKYQKFINRIPKDIKDEIKGFCDGSGFDYKKALENYIFPEIINYLISKYSSKNYSFKTHLSGASLGCTSIISTGFSNINGETLHARNFDFFGTGYLEKQPIVFFVEPTDGFKYTSVSSAGVVGAVISGINEKGISYAFHQNYTDVYEENNLPIFALGQLILKYADSLDKAKEIINSSKSTGGWSIAVSCKNSKHSFVAEICGNKVVYREAENNTLICTNSYIDEELSKEEIILNPLFNLSSISRYQRIHKQLEHKLYAIDSEFLLNLLGDRYDITSEKERIFGYTVSQNHTVSSILFAPEQDALWVAKGSLPVCNGDFVKIDFNFEKNKHSEVEIIKGNQFKNEKNTKVLNMIYEAEEFYKDNNIDESLNILKKASKEINNEDSTIPFMCGILLLKKLNVIEAIEFFKTAYENENDIYKSGVIKLWLGRSYDILDRRELAEKQYRYVEEMSNDIYGQLINLAEKGNKRPYKKSKAKKIDLDFKLGEEIYTR